MKHFFKFFNKKTEKSFFQYKGIEHKYYELLDKGKELILCITAGRSGTRWLTEIVSKHENAIGSCERYRIIESFYRYVKWNELPIDVQGIINIIKDSIVQDWMQYDISMIASPYLAHDLFNLYKILKPKLIIWGVNEPKFTIISFYNKGWYEEEIIRANDFLTNGLQPNSLLSHNFGRIIPKGQEYDTWKNLTRIGKIAWLYNTINLEIYTNLKRIPKDKLFIFRLEEADQNYEYYLRYAIKFGLKRILSKTQFLSIKKLSVKDSDNVQIKWSEKEKDEFKKNVNEFHQIYKNL